MHVSAQCLLRRLLHTLATAPACAAGREECFPAALAVVTLCQLAGCSPERESGACAVRECTVHAILGALSE